MKPVPFTEQNGVLAKDQPQYLPLPIHQSAEGIVVSCWRLSPWERIKLLFTGRLWLTQLTFGDPLQPQGPTVHYPFASPAVQLEKA